VIWRWEKERKIFYWCQISIQDRHCIFLCSYVEILKLIIKYFKCIFIWSLLNNTLEITYLHILKWTTRFFSLIINNSHRCLSLLQIKLYPLWIFICIIIITSFFIFIKIFWSSFFLSFTKGTKCQLQLQGKDFINLNCWNTSEVIPH
jgi:hypothetical protein